MAPVINLSSESWCRQAYLNYHCYGNTMGLTPVQMGQICGAWSDRVESWQDSVTTDETEYVFDDSDYDEYINQGREDAENQAGSKDLVMDAGRNTADTLFTAGAGVIAGTNCIARGTGAIGNSWLGRTFRNGVPLKEGKTTKTTNGSLLVSAGIVLATGLCYQFVKRNNEDSKKVCDNLQFEMTEAQSTLNGAQSDMCGYAEEVATLSDEATDYNEETNEEMEELKAEYDFYLKTYQALVEKIESGETLTDSEKDLYKFCADYLGEISTTIEDLSEENTDEVNDINDEMADYQAEYDTVAEKMGNIEGLTDYASEVDIATKNMCIWTIINHSINVASAGIVAARAAVRIAATSGLDWAAIAAAAMAVAGGAASGVAINQQTEWIKDISNEIALRKETEDLNGVTHEVYDEEIDYYAGMMEGVEDLEMVVPDDVEAPEEGPSPDTPPEDPEDPDDPKKKPMA